MTSPCDLRYFASKKLWSNLGLHVERRINRVTYPRFDLEISRIDVATSGNESVNFTATGHPPVFVFNDTEVQHTSQLLKLFLHPFYIFVVICSVRAVEHHSKSSFHMQVYSIINTDEYPVRICNYSFTVLNTSSMLVMPRAAL